MSDPKLRAEIEREAIRKKMQSDERDRLELQAKLKRDNFKIRASERAGKVAEKDAEATKIWREKVDATCKSLIDNDRKAYDSLVTAMHAIMSLGLLLNKAVAASDPLGSLYRTVKGFVEKFGIGGMAGAEKTYQKESEEATKYEYKNGEYLTASDAQRANMMKNFGILLPKLEAFVEFTNTNRLDVKLMRANLRLEDGSKLSKEQEYLFEHGVRAWLTLNECEDDPKNMGGFINKKTGDALTKIELEEMRDHPERGFLKFLSGHFELDVQHTPSPRP